MNRSAIDEEAGSEVLKVFELEKTSTKIREEKNKIRKLEGHDDPVYYDTSSGAYKNFQFKKEIKRKGIDFSVLEIPKRDIRLRRI